MVVTEKKHLSEIFFHNLENWSVQYLKGINFSYNPDFELVAIGDFLTRNKAGVEIQDEEEYKRVTIKIKNGGVFLRDVEIGKNIGTKNQFIISKGQFLLSKIDARNGAFGVVPEEVNGAIITGNFWTFDVDYQKINPHFLALLTTTPEFLFFCENASNGTTNRHYLQEDLFLKTKIPLPPLPEQNKIVETYNKKIIETQNAEKRAQELEKNIEEYLMDELGIEKMEEVGKKKGLQEVRFRDVFEWGVDKILNSNNLSSLLFSEIFENKKIRELVLINPASDIPFGKKISFIPMQYVSDKKGEVIKKDEKESIEAKGYTKFQENDLIWAKITPCMQNGKSAIVRNLLNGFGCGSTEFYVLRKNSPELNLEYLHMLLRLEKVLIAGTKYFTGSAGQQRVPKSFLENLKIPLPPLPIQQKIVEKISGIKTEIKNLKKLAEENRKLAIEEFEGEIFM